ncbi:putative HNH restriction endonuclease [Lysinibacillus composti]|uniref:HNH domain-containing protein n=1 Tax=Lysinibacillus composti TaxID=720633 RepID=A0A3N9U9N8_9BACI|nr:HNH endonuclease [Lysinibacillus composti]MBM7610136.1 putative HNH restriction endonuclease [Lysinibacillus composti]RQW73215.1 hypothetical protein EBB45_17795 [Lysinibacillus composti]
MVQKDEDSKKNIYRLREQFGLLDVDEIQFLDDNELIDSIKEIEINNDKAPTYNGTPKEKEEFNVNAKGANFYPRNLNVSVNALKMASFRCGCDNDHPTFIKKRDGNPYTELHHLIPLSSHSDFSYSLDVEENIVSLCSHCHNLLHYGRAI